MAADSVPWLALGIDLRMTRTEDGGRRKPLGVVPYVPLQYRPNWRLPGMPHPEQVGAPILCFGSLPLHPGDQTLAVIIPLVDLSLPLWEAVSVGDELRLYEGARDCGSGTVVWVARTLRPLPDEDADRFCAWTQGGPAPGGE